jgi:hypothetical protein
MWQAEARRQEDHEFKVSLGYISYIARPCLYPTPTPRKKKIIGKICDNDSANKKH